MHFGNFLKMHWWMFDYSIADYSGALLGILKRVPTVVLNWQKQGYGGAAPAAEILSIVYCYYQNCFILCRI